MAVEWTNDLATGSDEIDEQHKELFRRINAFMEACRQGKGREEVRKVIAFLDEYVVAHFSQEETSMRRYGYPGYETHKSEHREFMRNFSELRGRFECEGPGLPLVIQIKDMIVQWLLVHIRKVDRALGTFLKTKTEAR
ncbi:MAG: bacteriohemerythrin [Nitrospirae bacterium]|nr:bacteriohemerythrin [Nitrospirota bacterium]